MIVLLQFMRAFPGVKVSYSEREGKDAWEMGLLTGPLLPGMLEWLRKHKTHAVFDNHTGCYSLRPVFGPESTDRKFREVLGHASSMIFELQDKGSERALEFVRTSLYEAGVITTLREER